MSNAFTIANFRSVAKGLQPGQFAVGERNQASSLKDLDPKYKRLLDEPVTVSLGLIGPDGRVSLTPMWFDYEGDKVLVNTASHRPKCEWIRNSPQLTILLVNPRIRIIGCRSKPVSKRKCASGNPAEEYVTKQLDRIWTKYIGSARPLFFARPLD